MFPLVMEEKDLQRMSTWIQAKELDVLQQRSPYFCLGTDQLDR